MILGYIICLVFFVLFLPEIDLNCVYFLVEQPGAENQPGAEANQLPENENRLGKEIQIIDVGFVTSLFPGFHNVD